MTGGEEKWILGEKNKRNKSEEARTKGNESGESARSFRMWIQNFSRVLARSSVTGILFSDVT